MIAILPMAILLLTAISLLLIRLIRPAFRYYWLVMTIGALFAWAAQLATRWLLPTEVQNNLWAPSVLLPIQWNWGFDQTGWSFSLTVITIWLASLLTGVARTGRANQPRMSAGKLASGAILTTFLMLAVGSVHLSFLLFTWAVVDLCELIIYTVSVQSEDQSKNLSGWLITRFISLGLITWTAISSQPANEFAAPFLILAAMLRIGSIPPFLSPARQMDAPEPLESVLKFASLAPALALLVRISRTGIPPSSAGWLNAAVILALFYAGFGLAAWRWARRDDPLEGPAPRHEGPAPRNEGTIYWVIGIGALAAAAAIGQKPAAAQAAGVSMLLAGSMLLQFSVRPVLLSRLFWIVAICLTGLAFTPTWPLSMLYSPISINAILLLLGHGLLIAGYLQQAQVGARDGSPLSRPSTTLGPESWLWLLYTGGLMVLFAAMFLIAGPDPAFFKLPDRFIDLLPGVLICIVAIGLETLFNLRLPIIQRGVSALVDFLQLRWLFRLFELASIGAGKLLHLPNLLLEGQAGLIWAILLLVLLLTLFAQSGVPSQIGSGG